MVNLHLVLYVVAFICFVLAAIPQRKVDLGFQWLAFAALTLTLIL